MTDVQSTGTLVPQKKPGLVLATGIITIVFCSIGLLFSLSSLIGYLIFGGASQMMGAFRPFLGSEMENLYDSLMAIVMKYYPVILTVNLIYFASLVSGLVGGIFLIMGRKLGVLLLQIYAIAALVILAFQFVWMWSYISEAMGVMKDYFSIMGLGRGAGSFMEGIAYIGMYVGAILGVVFGTPWPILVLVFTTRKSMREYMHNRA